MSVSPCFDAGSRFCPCELAELGHCVACSLLRGETVCTCSWSGLCIYSEFIRNKKKPRPRRIHAAGAVVSRSDIGDRSLRDAFIVEIEVPPEISLWCVFPGSFVLLRPKGSPERFNVPLTVMQAGTSTVTTAVEVVGPKTGTLARKANVGNQVTVSGPFWSGLQGFWNLKKCAGGRALIVAKGIAQGCAVHTAKYVVDRGGFAKVLLGPGPIGQVFAEGAVRSVGASVEVLPKTKDHNLAAIFSELTDGEYDVLVSQGSNLQHGALQELLNGMENPPKFAWSSNLPMTCAEGICGSCLVQGFRGCKANLPGGAGFSS